MKADDLWEELKRRRVVRVALAYGAVVFMALQVADLTFEPLGFPDWTYRALLIISLIGFPLAVALAWAFDVGPGGVVRESVHRAETGDEGGRAAGMGRWVVAAAAVTAVAIGAWQFGGGPAPVGADELDTELIAVVPFRVASTDERVTILREGVIDLLAPIFNDAPRIVDAGAMISAWRRYAGDAERDLGEGEAVELARRVGAGRVLVGSVVGTGDAFALQARLLRVPGGEVIGDASVDGSAAGLREVTAQLAAQVLSMEAGVARGQLNVLADVSIDALESYLDGRRAYRLNDYAEARLAFARALDEDSTFALAALGAREAVMMGFDADRFGLLARADAVLRAHADRLPPREREYADAWLPEGRRSAAEVVREMSGLVSRLPDKAEAWYLYGDYLFHASQRVGEGDWLQRSAEAFQRALELDPGLEVAREHLLYVEGFYGDPDRARAHGEELLARIGEAGSVLPRAIMAYRLADAEQDAWLRARLDTLTFEQAAIVAFGAELPGETVPIELVDRALDRVEFVAVAEADRIQSLEVRYAYYRSSGRAAEADDQLRLIEQAYGPRPRWWLEAALYWDGVEETARSRVAELEGTLPSDGPLEWAEGGRDACILALWRLRDGDGSFAAEIAGRLEVGADDPDPAHGRNALCALLLRARSAELSGADDAGPLLDRLVSVLGAGATEAVIGWATLETAWMLERRGDLEVAARVAAYRRNNVPFQFAGSTIYREAGRLSEAAGDRETAAERYRWYFGPRERPDAGFVERGDSIRARFPEVAAGAPGAD